MIHGVLIPACPIIFFLWFGASIGSFLNVVIYRLPEGLALSKPKSRCPKCLTPIRFRDNVPILSWLVLRGKCRDCSASIAFRYPLIETTVAAIFGLLLFIEFGSGGANLPLVSVAPNASTWVTVELNGSGDVYGQEYHIMFDPSQVSVANVRLLPAAQGSAIAWNVVNGNELRIAIASLQPLAVTDAVEFELVGSSDLEGESPTILVLGFARLNAEELFGASSVEDLPDASATKLFQNHPNPFNPMTTIKFAVGTGQGDLLVQLTVFDARGHVVRQLVRENRSPGTHEVIWDGRDTVGRRVGSGLYFYKLDVAGKVLVNKMLLLK